MQVIKVENISKQYRPGNIGSGSFSTILSDDIWATTLQKKEEKFIVYISLIRACWFHTLSIPLLYLSYGGAMGESQGILCFTQKIIAEIEDRKLGYLKSEKIHFFKFFTLTV